MSKFIIIAGPCVVESLDLLIEVAELLSEIRKNFDNIQIIFKSSYRKANRTSISSFIGIGDEKALEYLQIIRDKFSFPILSDVHTPTEAKLYGKYLDVVQIPAFLSRQTELLIAAGETNRIVNIKKGQFLSPYAIKNAAEKVASTGNNKIWLTERGTFFGYNDLVVDFRSMPIMRSFGYPVIYDATHSLQKPSLGIQSGGNREFIFQLTRAAVGVGIDGIFFETHPNPDQALSDSATQLPLKEVKSFVEQILEIYQIARKFY
ncbi:MAG: 3-deoxy-8-phosphooctulonate synthase [Candidatus Kapaibacteriales bacterium]